MKPGPVRNIIRWLLAIILAGGSLAARLPAARADTDVTPWSAPFAIATGLPDAARPALAYTPDGQAHAMWESEGTVYYAVRNPGAAFGFLAGAPPMFRYAFFMAVTVAAILLILH